MGSVKGQMNGMTPGPARPQRMVRVGGLRARAGRAWRHDRTPPLLEWIIKQMETRLIIIGLYSLLLT